MTISPSAMLYLALALYAMGTLVALASLFTRALQLQHLGLGVVIAGFVSHTVWIGSICVRTGHPPLTNLLEAASFVASTVFTVQLALFVKYPVHAAAVCS